MYPAIIHCACRRQDIDILRAVCDHVDNTTARRSIITAMNLDTIDMDIPGLNLSTDFLTSLINTECPATTHVDFLTMLGRVGDTTVIGVTLAPTTA